MNQRLLLSAGVVALLAAGVLLSLNNLPDDALAVPEPDAVTASTAPTPRAAPARRATASALSAEEHDDAEAIIDTPEAADSPEAERVRAELAKWEEMGVVHATCALEPVLPVAEGYLSIGAVDQFNGRKVLVLDGVAHLPILEGHPVSGHLSIEGYAPEPISWTLPEEGLGHCEPAVVSLRAGGTVVTGAVTHTEDGAPAAGAWVEGCGNMGLTDEDGVYYLEAIPGPCTLIAMRQDGMLRTISAPTEVTVEDGRDLVVDLQIRGEKQGGVGISFEASDEGLRVLETIEGGAAAEAGLLEGDIVVSVDGEPAAELEVGELAQAIGGAAGSEVTLGVLDPDAEGGEREITIERRLLE